MIITSALVQRSATPPIEHIPFEVAHAADLQPPRAAGPTRSEPLWRVVGASLGTGSALALLLTLVVFAGAEEHVITGSALAAFATGWAMLGVLTRRFTSRPQRWAWVPAGVMGAVASLLFLLTPGDAALNTSGWLWPVAFFPMAVWMTVRVRRGFNGRVRWLLYPVTVAIALASVGGIYETASRARAADAYPPPGSRYDIGGRRLHLDCAGTGSPTVVVIGGLGTISANWARVIADVAGTTRVCAYDRAGQAWSDDADHPQDSVETASDLHALLATAGERGPFVLAGHSAGGIYAMTYAARYPDDVAGMVLLDSMSPAQFSALPDFEMEYALMRAGLGVMPSVARVGVTRAIPSSVYSDLPEPASSHVKAFMSSARMMRNMRDEHSTYRTALPQALALTSLGDTPLVVLTTTESVHETDGWSAAQLQLAALSSNSDARLVESTHGGLIEAPPAFGSSVRAIVDVVTAVRTGHAVARSSN